MILRLFGYLLRASSIVRRGEEQSALLRVADELVRLDSPGPVR